MHIALDQTIVFSMHAHRGQLDKSGKPYWMHPYRVMMRLRRVDSQVAHHAALLHDVVEDTDYDLEDLRGMGYSDQVLQAVDVVTRYKKGRDRGSTYQEWIEGIARGPNRVAVLVKYADLLDNLSPSRTSALPRQHRSIVTRLMRALDVIEPVVPAELRQLVVSGDIQIPGVNHATVTGIRHTSRA